VSALRDKYLKTLGLHAADEPTKAKRSKALDRAYELRTFEIEHYWKRATYFWGFQIAIFAAFGLLWRAAAIASVSAAAEWNMITVALSGLGVITAAANYLSARGSTFWQKNWEKHIDMLEDEFEGRLYKTVWLREGKASFSVSRVNLGLSGFVFVFWVLVTFYVTYKFVELPSPEVPHNNICQWGVLAIVLIVIAFCVLVLAYQKSDLDGSWPNEDGSHGNPFIRHLRKPQQFIRRYAPDEPDKGDGTSAA
jgi:hypothetical protein